MTAFKNTNQFFVNVYPFFHAFFIELYYCPWLSVNSPIRISNANFSILITCYKLAKYRDQHENYIHFELLLAFKPCLFWWIIKMCENRLIYVWFCKIAKLFGANTCFDLICESENRCRWYFQILTIAYNFNHQNTQLEVIVRCKTSVMSENTYTQTHTKDSNETKWQY